jgi:arylamine N-acetyltransferase
LTDRSSFQAAPDTVRGVLTPQTTEAVLERLGFSDAPTTDLDGLNQVYGAWCEHIRFDNIVKRIHLVSGSPAPIPNGPPEAFFASYLEHRTGGTCWPSSGALFALVDALGFDARRGSGAMRDDLSGPVHSHGTVLVRFDDGDYWVDTSMLTMRAFRTTQGFDDPVHATRIEPTEPYFRVWWTHPFLDEMLGCLLLDDNVTQEHYLARYEWSRGQSPFNAGLYAVRSTPDARVTLAFGQRFERTPFGVSSRPLVDDRCQVLIEEFGYSEAIVVALPNDDPPPPTPR